MQRGKKAKIGALLLGGVLLFQGLCASSDTQPRVMVNGQMLDTEAIMKDDRVFVPLRAVSESLGADVSWDEENETAVVQTVSYDDTSVSAMVESVSKSVVAIIGNYGGVDAMSGGAGVVIKPAGEILTNAHVVKDLNTIVVVLWDGSCYEGQIKYIDEAIDLAVVKIGKLGLPAIRFANSDSISTGQTVFAIGTPVSFSLRNSVSKGIISGLNRAPEKDYRFLQTDTAINPGNSGGPLVNLNGELVGINTWGYAGTTVSNLNFAIPVDTVSYALSQFEKNGKIVRVDLGATLDEGWAASMGLPTPDGLTVSKVRAGGPAEAAGIVVGDSIVKLGADEIHSLVDWNEAIKNYVPGSQAEVTLWRNQEFVNVTVLFK